MPTDRVRVTVTVEPHVYEIFQRMAKAGRQSLSMCMGEWLGDTADGALAITAQMEKVRRDPLKAVHNLQLYAAAMQEGAGNLVEQIAKDKRAVRTAPPRSGGLGASPVSTPPSNTGWTETTEGHGQGGKA